MITLHSLPTNTTVHARKTVGEINEVNMIFYLVDENASQLVDEEGNELVANMTGGVLLLHAPPTDTTVRSNGN